MRRSDGGDIGRQMFLERSCWSSSAAEVVYGGDHRRPGRYLSGRYLGIGDCHRDLFDRFGLSGAHLNPAVTISLAAWGGFSKRRVLPYIVVQLALSAFAGLAAVLPVFHFCGWRRCIVLR